MRYSHLPHIDELPADYIKHDSGFTTRRFSIARQDMRRSALITWHIHDVIFSAASRRYGAFLGQALPRLMIVDVMSADYASRHTAPRHFAVRSYYAILICLLFLLILRR